jgi:hypothetical protein
MSLSAGNVDDIFAVVGKILHLDEISQAERATFLAYKTALEATLDDELATEYASIYDNFSAIEASVSGMESYSQGWLDSILTSYPVIWNNLNLSGYASPRDVAQIILRELLDLSESVAASATSIGSITYDLATADAFSILTDGTLDGATAPAAWMQASIYHNGLTTQCGIDEDIEFLAESLNPSQLTLRGKGDYNVNASAFQALSAGSGRISFAHANNLLPALDEFTSGSAPSGWDLIAPASDSGFSAETTDTFGEDVALKILGDGVIVSHEKRYDLSASITPLKRYCVVCFVKGNAALTTGALTITTGGTGYSSPAGIALNQAALAAQTSYGIESFFFTAPADFVDDFYLSVKLDGTPSAHAIYVSKLCFVPVEWFNGWGVVPVKGEPDVVTGDRALVPFENDYAGVWQTLYPRKTGYQLPSSGSPTILDSLIV